MKRITTKANEPVILHLPLFGLVLLLRFYANLLDIVNRLTVEANVSKNQLINVALYEFLKQQNVLKDELKKDVQELQEFQNSVIASLGSNKLGYFHSAMDFAFNEPLTLHLTIPEYFELVGVKNNRINKSIFQVLLKDFNDQWSPNEFNETLNDPVETLNKNTKSIDKPVENTNSSIIPPNDDLMVFLFGQVNVLLEKILDQQKFFSEKLQILIASQARQKDILTEPINSIVDEFLPVSYSYNNLYPNEDYLIVDFQLFRILIENANFYVQRSIRPRKSQIRVIYCLLYGFGLDLSELIHLKKLDVELAIRDQKIKSNKYEGKWKKLRQDESTGFLIKVLTKSLKISSFSFKFGLPWKDKPKAIPLKFQIYNKTLDVSRVTRLPIECYYPVTRFELTILNSPERFSSESLFDFQDLYLGFLKNVSIFEFENYQHLMADKLYKNFVTEKQRHPKLDVTLFIVKNHSQFVTRFILQQFYFRLYENQFVKSQFKSFYYKFQKTKKLANIQFSSLEEVNILIQKLRKQLQ